MILLAEKDKSIEQAVNSAWQLISDPVIREQCRTREEWIVYDRYRDKVIEEQKNQLIKQDETIAEQGETIAEQAEEIRRLKELMKESK